MYIQGGPRSTFFMPYALYLISGQRRSRPKIASQVLFFMSNNKGRGDGDNHGVLKFLVKATRGLHLSSLLYLFLLTGQAIYLIALVMHAFEIYFESIGK